MITQTDPLQAKGRLHRFLDLGGQGISIERNLFPGFLEQANQSLLAGDKERARGLMTEANIASVERMVQRDRTLTDVMYVLAKLLHDAGFSEKAKDWYESILSVEVHPQVLDALATIGSKGQAIAYRYQALALSPEDPRRLRDYADALVDAGRVQEGVGILETLQRKNPEDFGVLGRLAWNTHYLPGYDQAYHLKIQRCWAKQFSSLTASSSSAFSRKENGRFKLGILSGNFVNNSVMNPFERVAELLGRQGFDIVAYSNVKPAEGVDVGRERWMRIADVFHEVHAFNDVEVADLIRSDRVDILMEVGGECSHSRLGVFALHPASVQVDYGALSPLCMSAIEYRISEALLEPPELLSGYQEHVFYLPQFSLYAPPELSPAVTPLPAKSNGMITFGAFNNHRKINAMTLDLWAQVLTQVPTSRLVIKFLDGDDPIITGYYRDQLARRGIDSQRITFYGKMGFESHLQLLGQCDLMLDTFPFNGARGTLEALWMGVPTVSLTGETFVSREGLSRQSPVGLSLFAADDPAGYVARAVSFAGQWEQLEAIRLSLRQRMLSSPLCDPYGWTREFERVLREMWTHRGRGH